ncbi:MAG: SDR family oxidoreductase [Rhodospirillales bacterium]|nr:SDR family oxidoreductase [Rhodospirillales bacterium]
MRALVTGAAGGLGEAVAARLVRDRWSAALVDCAEAVRELAARLAAEADGPVVAFVADVADVAEVDAAVAAAVDALGGLDLVVNIAGVGGPSTTVVATDPDDFRRVLDVNLVGPFLVSRAAARSMIDRGEGGAIVNFGSIFGQQGVAGGAAYCASKGGLALLTHSLARELAPHGIRVNTIAPGHMATEMHWEELRGRAALNGTSFGDELAAVRAEIPLGRHGTGEDVAGAVAWLASADAVYVTGQTIGVNGGVILS